MAALRHMACHSRVLLSLVPLATRLRTRTILRLLPVPPLAWPVSPRACPACNSELVLELNRPSQERLKPGLSHSISSILQIF